MFNFHLINSTISGFELNLIIILPLISILFGILTITSKNPVISVLFLIGLFVTVSIYLMVMGLYFLGLSYLLVYVGAISILFIFILMLINVRISELVTEGLNSTALALITVFIFYLTIGHILPYCVQIIDKSTNLMKYVNNTLYKLNLNWDVSANLDNKYDYTLASISSKSWDNLLIENNHITSIGNVLYTNLFILLIITALIILLAMVGTIIITVKDTIKKN